jgi:hypothetical protein
MIELERDALVFSFPEVHADAVLRVEFQRTLRIPDDDRSWPLPPGLGRFPLRHVDDFAANVSEAWRQHGGVMLPMYQSEALWLRFSSPHGYPFALKVAAGRIDAVTGVSWSPELHRDPQDYVAIPGQPWLDGFCVEKGVVRQFVAMPLGSGYSAEEQITGAAEHGGIQLLARPLLASRYRPQRDIRVVRSRPCLAYPSADMALAPGGRMRQEIYEDARPLGDWDPAHAGRCFVHLANSLVWRAITGEAPPTVPPTAREYSEAGLPWFEYYGEGAALEGSAKLAGLQSVAQKSAEKGEPALPENEPVEPAVVVPLGPKARRRPVREATF